MNAQGKRKSLTDDSLHVDSVGKVFAGQLLAYYPWCALFEISGCQANFIVWNQRYHLFILYLSSYLFHVKSLNIVVPGT